LTDYLETASGRRIAYNRHPGLGPGIVFLGGFKSDMDGTKALHLEKWAKLQGRAFLRFDYSGHGKSSGEFTDGSIGDWATDANAAIIALTDGPQIFVGSSMGGWISLILAAEMSNNIAGFVGIASAPDFTEDSMWANFSDAQLFELDKAGQVTLRSEYGDPYIITKRLIEGGRQNLVLRKPLNLPFPTVFLQGTADIDVEQSVGLRLFEHATGDDIRLTLVKGADHRFSTPECLALVTSSIEDILARL
jgi:pimeloyl-ACP methyl ester carboxylesterase